MGESNGMICIFASSHEFGGDMEVSLLNCKRDTRVSPLDRLGFCFTQENNLFSSYIPS